VNIHYQGDDAMTLQRIRFSTEYDTGFRRALNARVDDHFARTGKSRFADWRVWTKAVTFGIGAMAFYGALLASALPGWGEMALAGGYGLSVLFLAINVSHDAAHGALTGNRRVDGRIHRVLFGLLGVDGYLWQMRHNGSHHVFPNVNGCDIDIDENPFLRLSPNHPRRGLQRWQHLYAPFVYLIVVLHSVFYGDFVYLFKTQLANMRDIRHKRGDVVLFAVGKLAYVALNIGLPLVFIHAPAWRILAGYAAVTAMMSLLFVMLLIGTHFAQEVEFPMPSGMGVLPRDWAVHALETSVDWMPGSRLAEIASGGANTHAAHHLFPRVSHVHYRAITPLLKATAAEHGIRYNETTLGGMLRSHFRHLRAMGANQPAHPA
jgi:linoleoyl-CoA desaturase